MRIDQKKKLSLPASETEGARPQELHDRQAFLTLPPAVLLDHFHASLVLITPEGDIVSFYGPSERYLAHPAGRADLNLFSMARPQLSEPAAGRSATSGCSEGGGAPGADSSRVEGAPRLVDVTITPYRADWAHRTAPGRHFPGAAEAEAAPPPLGPATSGRAEQLEAELRASRAELLAANAEFEASREQMLATQEEAAAVNEELQSTNEELEASQEELQSLNEELTTLNVQLNESLGELAATNNDLLNLFDATEIATIFLDQGLAHPAVHAGGRGAAELACLGPGPADSSSLAELHRHRPRRRGGSGAQNLSRSRERGARARRGLVHDAWVPLSHL